MTEWNSSDVRARLRELAERDPACERFGAATHRYALSPAPAEADIGAFEARLGVQLPPEYREFVARVGDGPAGPGHGLLPLAVPRPEATEEDGWAVDDEWATDRLPGRAAARFPLDAPLPGPQPGRRGAAADELTPGTLVLADQGCGIYDRLVLTGRYAGEVWRIDTDWGGFVPLSSGFREWYVEWLEA
ncbi:SMI1/KNR4 family protein [Streptomyces sp. Da 82-17]|uniref:SMI1/KNR4 family protein n=1 Tax=Streptomyces sp. Da 82-17 TaxID=3377116 RepID=UPI0038D475F3